MWVSKRSILVLILSVALIVLSGCVSLILAEIVIAPPDLPIGCGQEAVFSAIGYDNSKHIVPLTSDLIWSVLPDDGVIITAYPTSHSAAFTFPEGGTYTIMAVSGHIVEEYAIDVICSELTSIQVLPLALDMKIGETHEFSVTGYDQYDNPMAITQTVSWSVTGGIGTINPESGLSSTFEAQMVGDGTVKVDVGSLSCSVSINVSPASVLTSILISPRFTTALEGKCTDLTATPYDQYGDVMVLEDAPVWLVTGGIGTTSPAIGWTTKFCASNLGTGDISVTYETVTDALNINVIGCG